MISPARQRVRPWRLTAVGAALVLVAACGESGDDDPEAGGSEPSSPSSSTTSADGSADWCHELETLDRSEGISPELIADAPKQLRASLEALADAADPAAEGSPSGTARRLLGAQAAVESWDHEHCGGEHPFCTLYVTVDYAVASTALAGEDQAANAELEAFLAEVDDLLSEYAPDEERDNVDTFLSYLDSGATPSDEDERAAEAASDALDEWAWSEGCTGASPPDEQEP